MVNRGIASSTKEFMPAIMVWGTMVRGIPEGIR